MSHSGLAVASFVISVGLTATAGPRQRTWRSLALHIQLFVKRFGGRDAGSGSAALLSAGGPTCAVARAYAPPQRGCTKEWRIWWHGQHLSRLHASPHALPDCPGETRSGRTGRLRNALRSLIDALRARGAEGHRPSAPSNAESLFRCVSLMAVDREVCERGPKGAGTDAPTGPVDIPSPGPARTARPALCAPAT